jgi:hypothetical protein
VLHKGAGCADIDRHSGGLRATAGIVVAIRCLTQATGLPIENAFTPRDCGCRQLHCRIGTAQTTGTQLSTAISRANIGDKISFGNDTSLASNDYGDLQRRYEQCHLDDASRGNRSGRSRAGACAAAWALDDVVARRPDGMDRDRAHDAQAKPLIPPDHF